MAYTAESYPAYEGSSVIPGKKFLLYVAYDSKWNLVGGMRDTSLNITAETIDSSNKDDDGWGSSLPGTRAWDSAPSLVVKKENEGDAIIEEWFLNEALQDERPALRFAFVNAIDKTYYDGWGVVTAYNIEASYSDVMTKSITINGVGAITKKTGFDKTTLAESVE